MAQRHHDARPTSHRKMFSIFGSQVVCLKCSELVLEDCARFNSLLKLLYYISIANYEIINGAAVAAAFEIKSAHKCIMQLDII